MSMLGLVYFHFILNFVSVCHSECKSQMTIFVESVLSFHLMLVLEAVMASAFTPEPCR